ncbi:VOC family protein [Piscirickettsia salmonis]|uniref:VOC family protein n=2 Tax=Piscirickettsia salmonis TaxID=1238 RepID=UPI0015CF7E57|nr:VOC family protein [Piscirickettsia salmonis]
MQNTYRGSDAYVSAWAVRTQNINNAIDLYTKYGINIGTPFSMSRQANSGIKHWKMALSHQTDLEYKGVIPFPIEWALNNHPILNLPPQGKLISLNIETQISVIFSRKSTYHNK